MMSFYRTRSPLIASANTIPPFLHCSPSRSSLSAAGKTTISSAFSVNSPVDVQRRFYHNGNFFHASQEPNRGLSPSLHGSPSRSNLSAGKTTICSEFSVFSPIDVQRRSYHHGNNSHSSQEPNKGLWQKALSFLPQLVVFTVPYTNRRRLVTVPIKLYSEVFVWGWENIWSKLDSMPEMGRSFQFLHEMRRSFQFLPETDPQSIRVRLILRDIIDVLHKDLKKNGVKAEHLDGLNWEVLVTSGPPITIPLSGGKIVISTSFLRDFATDAEVATCIGHQVAQMVAGHQAEVFNLVPIAFILLFPRLIFRCLVPSIAEKIQQIMLITPQGKIVMEADYIGMILIALAGYDPQVAPSVYEKFGRLHNPDGNPTGKERALKVAQFMEEAVNKYEEVKANYQILPRKMGGLKLIPKVKS